MANISGSYKTLCPEKLWLQINVYTVGLQFYSRHLMKNWSVFHLPAIGRLSWTPYGEPSVAERWRFDINYNSPAHISVLPMLTRCTDWSSCVLFVYRLTSLFHSSSSWMNRHRAWTRKPVDRPGRSYRANKQAERWYYRRTSWTKLISWAIALQSWPMVKCNAMARLSFWRINTVRFSNPSSQYTSHLLYLNAPPSQLQWSEFKIPCWELSTAWAGRVLFSVKVITDDATLRHEFRVSSFNGENPIKNPSLLYVILHNSKS